MKFDNEKVNLLLSEMEVILNNVKATNEDFQRKLAKMKHERFIEKGKEVLRILDNINETLDDLEIKHLEASKRLTKNEK